MKNHVVQTTYRVVEAYHRSNDDPIVLHRGDPVKVGREFTDDPGWPGWIWCENTAGQGGWVPKRLLKIMGSHGTALADYTARELSIQPEERLMVDKILNGWAFARRLDGDTGWVPMRNLQPQST